MASLLALSCAAPRVQMYNMNTSSSSAMRPAASSGLTAGAGRATARPAIAAAAASPLRIVAKGGRGLHSSTSELNLRTLGTHRSR
jgi:hypothetical protein